MAPAALSLPLAAVAAWVVALPLRGDAASLASGPRKEFPYQFPDCIVAEADAFKIKQQERRDYDKEPQYTEPQYTDLLSQKQGVRIEDWITVPAHATVKDLKVQLFKHAMRSAGFRQHSRLGAPIVATIQQALADLPDAAAALAQSAAPDDVWRRLYTALDLGRAFDVYRTMTAYRYKSCGNVINSDGSWQIQDRWDSFGHYDGGQHAFQSGDLGQDSAALSATLDPPAYESYKAMPVSADGPEYIWDEWDIVAAFHQYAPPTGVQLLPGAQVELHGLSNNNALNGRVGVVLEDLNNKTAEGRVPVLLEPSGAQGGKKECAVRPKNLQTVSVLSAELVAQIKTHAG